MEQCATDSPQDDVNDVDPPRYSQPVLVDEQCAAIEPEQGEFDTEEGRTGEDCTEVLVGDLT